jgi:hypothetical protein
MAKAVTKRSLAQPGLPAAITLHISPAIREVESKQVQRLLAEAAPALPSAHLSGDLMAGPAGRRAALAFAAGRIKSPQVEGEFLAPKAGDFEFELQADSTGEPGPLSLLHTRLYDGLRILQGALPLIPPEERTTDHLHVWVTRRLLVTYSKDDYRYHARFAVHGYPTAFSVPALRYAPAPSKQAAIAQVLLARQGLPPEMAARAVEEQFANETFDPEDPRLVSAAVVSSTLQACARAAGLEAFCTDGSCRLFNAHRKPEFLATILSHGLCKDHKELFRGGAK